VRAIGPLTVTILSIALVSIFRLYNAPHRIKIVGSIPQVSRLPVLPPVLRTLPVGVSLGSVFWLLGGSGGRPPQLQQNSVVWA